MRHIISAVQTLKKLFHNFTLYLIFYNFYTPQFHYLTAVQVCKLCTKLQDLDHIVCELIWKTGKETKLMLNIRKHKSFYCNETKFNYQLSQTKRKF